MGGLRKSGGAKLSRRRSHRRDRVRDRPQATKPGNCIHQTKPGYPTNRHPRAAIDTSRLVSHVVMSEPSRPDRYRVSRRSFAGETVVRGSARVLAPNESVPLAAARGVVTAGVALAEGPLPHFGDLRRRLEQPQQIQPTGEPLRFVASFANEHSLDPPVLGGGEQLQDKARPPTLASSLHATILRTGPALRARGRPEAFA